MPRYPINYAGAFRHTQPLLSLSLPLVNHPLLVISRAIFVLLLLKIALITHSGAHPSSILIDLTIAAHNSSAADRASLPGCAAEARYAAKAVSYAATIVLPLIMCSFSFSQLKQLASFIARRMTS